MINDKIRALAFCVLKPPAFQSVTWGVTLMKLWNVRGGRMIRITNLLKFYYVRYRKMTDLQIMDAAIQMGVRAVEAALKLGAKVIWLPTNMADNHIRKEGRGAGGFKFSDYIKANWSILLISFVICVAMLPSVFKL